MKEYTNFIGIDIAKANFVVANFGDTKTITFDNNKAGFNEFYKTYKKVLPETLVAMETTGGYESSLLEFLVKKKVSVHRGNARKIKNFIRSLRDYGKTDEIDAHGIAQYASERHKILKLYELPKDASRKLMDLSRRRKQLIKYRSAEKTRLVGPEAKNLSDSYKSLIKFLNKEIDEIDKDIECIIKEDKEMSEKVETMQTIPGIGKVTANALLAHLPEIGTFTRREIASISGVAPHPYSSGDYEGYRSTRGGRSEIKPILFISAMAASRGNHNLGLYYRHLIAEKKKPIVALVALMRKIIVIANARIRDMLVAQEKLLLEESTTVE